MSSTLQSVSALVIVATCATWLLVRSLSSKKKVGCSGDCGCPSQELRDRIDAAEKARGRG